MFHRPPPFDPPAAAGDATAGDEPAPELAAGDVVTWTRHDPYAKGPGGAVVVDRGLVLAVDDEGHATIGWFTHVTDSFPIAELDGHRVDDPADAESVDVKAFGPIL